MIQTEPTIRRGPPQSPSRRRVHLAVPGAAAGALAALAFATVHALVISDIWYSLVPMMVAGAVCGATIGWSYGRLFEPSIRSWLGYNAGYVIALALLGLVSVAAFEPRMTMAELLTTDGPPTDLINAAFPMTILFSLGAAAILTAAIRRTPVAFGAVLLTCAVLVGLLGLNISVIGLIEIPTNTLYLVAELFGLVIVLAGSFAAFVLALAWRELGAAPAAPDLQPGPFVGRRR